MNAPRKISFSEPGDFVITAKDRATALGSRELRPCPFCGRLPIIGGRVNSQTGYTVYEVLCTASDCQAKVFFCASDPNDARALAVYRWNRRVV
ncbi:MAG: Lar family restriction alleviation protein [Verrucomicrobiales bacterium]|nr:Lar family restriction alleviation protein [Verrucomicrobiales bacterium]